MAKPDTLATKQSAPAVEASHALEPKFRPDLAQHLSGPDGFKDDGRLHGTHNQQNALRELQARHATISLKPIGTKGINQLAYRIVDPQDGVVTTDSKTVYDAAIYSDEQILGLAKAASIRAFEAFKANPSQRIVTLSEGGVKFRVYINIQPGTGAPFVGNVHPVK